MSLGMVGTSVIFAISSTGAAKSKANFMLVAGAIAMVGRKLMQVTKEAELFAQAFGKLNTEQRNALSAMEATSKGLVDTKVAMDSVVSATEAGLKVTPQLMSSITVLASDMAQKLGEGPEGATRRVKQLTDAISKGQTRALKQYGIDLANTESLLGAQEEAMMKVQARAEGLSVELENLDEVVYALGNNMDTYLGMLKDVVGSMSADAPIIGTFNRQLEEQNKIIMDTNGHALDAAISMEYFGDAILAIGDGLPGMIYYFATLGEKMEKIVIEGHRLAAVDLGTELGGAAAGVAALTGQSYDEVPVSIFSPENLAALENFAPGSVFDMTADEMTMGKGKGGKKKPKKTGGGGGGKKKGPEALEMTDAELTELYLEMALMGTGSSMAPDLAGGTGEGGYFGEGESTAGALDWLESTKDDMIDIEAEYEAIKADMKADAAAAELEGREARWQLELDEKGKQKELEKEHHEWLLENSEEYSQAQLAIARQEQMTRLALVASSFGNLSSLMDTENRKAFKIGKAAAASSAVINTALAAIKAYQAMAGIPYIGPALGAAAAAAAVVAGGVQLAKIKNTKFGSGSGGTFAGGTGTGGGVNVGGLGGGGGAYAGGFAGGQGSQPVNVTFKIGEGTIADALFDINESQQQQGNPRSFAQYGE